MKPTVSTATLTLVTLHEFSLHAAEIGANRVYITVSSNPTDAQLVRSGEGQFNIVATARTPQTILRYVKLVRGVTHIDAHVNLERAEAAIGEQLSEIALELEAASFIVERGRWGIKLPFDVFESEVTA